MGANDRISRALVGRAVDLNRFSAAEQRAVARMLGELRDELERELRGWDPAGPQRTAFRKARLARLDQEVTRLLADYMGPGGKARALVNEVALEVMRLQAEGVVRLVNADLGVDFLSMTLTGAQLRALASDLMLQGSPAAEWWDAMRDSTRRRFMSEVRMSVMRGETVDQTARAVLGMKDGSGGVLAETTQQAKALVRTAIQTANNAAHLAVFQGNRDILKGIQWVSTLDTRTTPICRGLDGLVWDMDLQPVDHSIPFPGPTAHWGCRSTQVPVTKSFEELLADAGTPARLKRDLRDASTAARASMDGQVAGKLTYDDWLRSQPVARQKEVLGPARWDLWRRGKLDMTDMLDFSGRPLTLDELASR